MKKFFIIIILIISLFIGCFLSAVHPSASEKKPVFDKKYHQVKVGKIIHFKVKHLRNSYRIIYTSSNNRIASIDRKSGKCVGKKAGKCIIMAKIYNKRHVKVSTVKQTLKVINSSLLPNASFHLIQSINPYDYTIKLGCSRILLKKEVSRSQLTIKKNGSNSTLTASFSNLSSNGKEITYTLTSQSQKILSPQDGTMNGLYTLSSPLFTKKLPLSYHERLGNQSLSGYVFSVEGNPINQAYVKCITDNSVKICKTDNNGFYRLEKIKNPISLTVTKPDYFSETLTKLKTSTKSTMCENIILHHKNNTNFSCELHIRKQDGTAISDVSVFLLDDKETIIFSGDTDNKGNICLYSNKTAQSVPCTVWYINRENSLSYESCFSSNTSNKKKLPTLSLDKKYTLLIGKLPQNNSPGYKFRCVSFCPKDYSTQHFYFDIGLSESRPLSLQNLSLDCNINSKQYPALLHLSLYQKGNSRPIFDSTLNEEYFSIQNNLLTFSHDIPCYLPDDTYYIKIRLMDKKEEIIYSFPMTELSIFNEKCSSTKISPLPGYYARILAYGDFTQANAVASFQRYQCIDGQYFYLDTLITSPFQGKKLDTKTANLILPYTQPEITYLLVPEKGTIMGKNHITFSAEKNMIYATKESALSSPSVAKTECLFLSEVLSSEIISKSSNTKLIPTASSHFAATKDYVRSCPSYPNSVTVFYKKDGTLLSAALTTSPSKNIDIKKNHSIIMDIYTNGKKLYTTQTNYNK